MDQWAKSVLIINGPINESSHTSHDGDGSRVARLLLALSMHGSTPSILEEFLLYQTRWMLSISPSLDARIYSKCLTRFLAVSDEMDAEYQRRTDHGIQRPGDGFQAQIQLFCRSQRVSGTFSVLRYEGVIILGMHGVPLEPWARVAQRHGGDGMLPSLHYRWFALKKSPNPIPEEWP